MSECAQREFVFVLDRVWGFGRAFNYAGTSIEETFVEDVIDHLIFEKRATVFKTELFAFGFDERIPFHSQLFW